MSSLTFYYDYLSQPARAVGLLIGATELPHGKRPLKLPEGESRRHVGRHTLTACANLLVVLVSECVSGCRAA